MNKNIVPEERLVIMPFYQAITIQGAIELTEKNYLDVGAITFKDFN